MEAEVISMMIKMFNGGQHVCGTFTNGGTESILLACKAYQQWGRSQGIRKPEIVVSSTAHASYKKACYYFKMKYVEVPALPDGLVDLNEMKRKNHKYGMVTACVGGGQGIAGVYERL